MNVGLRELRINLSHMIDHVREGNIIFITRADTPVAALIGLKKLETLASNASDTNLLKEIKESKRNKDDNLKKIKEDWIRAVNEFLDKAKKEEDLTGTTEKLRGILYVLQNLISDKGSTDDERLLYATIKKMEQTIEPILEKDYYNVKKDFIKLVQESVSRLNLEAGDANLAASARQLGDLIENAVIIPKSQSGGSKVDIFTSVLLSIERDSKTFFKIFTLLPFEYRGKQKYPNFTDVYSPIGKKLIDKKIGEFWKTGNTKYKVLGVT